MSFIPFLPAEVPAWGKGWLCSGRDWVTLEGCHQKFISPVRILFTEEPSVSISFLTQEATLRPNWRKELPEELPGSHWSQPRSWGPKITWTWVMHYRILEETKPGRMDQACWLSAHEYKKCGIKSRTSKSLGFLEDPGILQVRKLSLI